MSSLTIELKPELADRVVAVSAAADLSPVEWVEKILIAQLPPKLGEHEDKSAFELMQGGIGCIDSGVPDLTTNPKHMEGFGRWRR